MISFFQAFLWEDESVFAYFFVLGLHVSSLAFFAIAQDPETKFGKPLCSYTHAYSRWDSYKQHIVIGAFLSVVNGIFTALELLFLVRKHIRSFKIDRNFSSLTNGMAATTTAGKTAAMHSATVCKLLA